jgi:hypothetical protein
MAAARAAPVPVAVGERLVYEDRAGGRGTGTQTLGMRLVALRRDHLELNIDRDGQALATGWRQDLAGNTLVPNAPAPVAGRALVAPAPTPTPPLLAWRRLLKTDLELGQVLAGELVSPDPLARPARVRGQVVARGPQQVAGRNFNVVVIELFGDAPGAGEASTRLDGVMAVDAASGLLLRLDLNSANPDFALRRRLMRVDPAAP